MQVKRFVAADMRRALEMVRQALGPEAIILSSNRIAEGVELLTTLGTDAELAQLQARPEPQLGVAAMPAQPQHSRPEFSYSEFSQSEPARPQITRAQVPSAATMPVAPVSAAAVSTTHSSTSPSSTTPMAHLGAHPNASKTGQQLVAEIERAQARRMAAQQAEASVKDFLLAQQAKTQAQAQAQAPQVVRTLRETRRELRSDMSQVRKRQQQPVAAAAAPQAPDFASNLARELAAQQQALAARATAQVAQLRRAAPLPEATKNASSKAAPSAMEHYARLDVAQLNTAASSDLLRELTPRTEAVAPTPELETELARVMKPVVAPVDTQIQGLQSEIADMRLLLEEQLARLTDAHKQDRVARLSPALASVSRRLERLGLPQDVIEKVVARCKSNRSLSESWTDAMAQLSHQIPVAGEDLVDAGGVFALVGPTGAGKTTTIGKLAARFVLKHGADKVAIVTLDNYRIAAHDQLRSLARILRVPVQVVNESQNLETVLENLRHYQLVLIDTAGFRHGDARLRKQITALSENRQINTLLVMPCNSQAQMLKASVHAYGSAGLKGCILTKLDETASLGEALGVAMQHNLPVVYTTNGQDIPKHLDVAKAHQIVYRATALLNQQQKQMQQQRVKNG